MDILREFVKEQGIEYFYDVIDDPDGKWVFNPLRPAQSSMGQYAECATRLWLKKVILGLGRCYLELLYLHGRCLQSICRALQHRCRFCHGHGKLLIKCRKLCISTRRSFAAGGHGQGHHSTHYRRTGFDGATYRAMQFDGEGPGAFRWMIA